MSPATKGAKSAPATNAPVGPVPACMVEAESSVRPKGKAAADKRPVAKCGTVRSYNEGCRGDACVQAMREYRRERAAQDA